MAWFFNFCAPHLPNDPTINFHRLAQTGALMGFLVIYMVVHAYYKIYGSEPSEEKQSNQQSNSEGASQNQKGSQQNSENNHEDDKSVSIAGGGYGADQNQSYVTFEAGKKKKNKKNDQKTKKKVEPEVKQKVTLQQVQSYFPIVFGHFSIGSAFSIGYSPYAQQSIATILYIIFALLLVFVNAKRMIKTTRFIWGVMCFLICFLVMSGLLEVGQANFNKMKQQCFSVDYKSLY